MYNSIWRIYVCVPIRSIVSMYVCMYDAGMCLCYVCLCCVRLYAYYDAGVYLCMCVFVYLYAWMQLQSAIGCMSLTCLEPYLLYISGSAYVCINTQV